MSVTIEAPQEAQKQGFWARNRWVLALGAVVAIGGCLSGVTVADQAQTIASQTTQIAKLQQDVSSQEAQLAKATEQNATQALGVSDSRVKKDTAEIRQLLATAFTWDSGDSYETARETLKSRFDLPPARFNQDNSGKRYYYLDATGLNSALGSNVDIEVVEVSATTYRYAVMADTEVGVDGPDQLDGQGNPLPKSTATRRVLVLVTTDATGKLTHMIGFPASGAKRQSR